MKKSLWQRWIFVLALAVSFEVTAGAYHAFHTSLAQIQYNGKAKVLEVSLRVFTDDLELALTKTNNRTIKLDESAQFDAPIEAYVRKYFGIVDEKGQKLAMSYIGREFEADATWIYLEIPFAENASELKLQNAILTEVFDDQTNVVNLTYQASKKTFLFKRDATTQPLAL
jgi:hypothetical protein